MRKIFVFLLLSFLSFLVGCDPAPYLYDYKNLYDDVASVEIIDYNNPGALEVFGNEKPIQSFDFSKAVTIQTITHEKTENFLLEFSQIELLLVWRHLDSPKGKCVKINYYDGSFDVICYEVQFSCQYDEFGNVTNVIGGGGGYQLSELVRSFADF